MGNGCHTGGVGGTGVCLGVREGSVGRWFRDY